MNNNQNLSNELMKQDGITPVGVSDAERDNFRAMLEKERKRVVRMGWIVQIPLWVFLTLLLALCTSEKLLNHFNIPFVVAWGVLMLLVCVTLVPLSLHMLSHLRASRTKLRRLQALMPEYIDKKPAGIIIVGKKDGKHIIRWHAVITIGIRVWLIMTLSSSGVYYLLSGHWFPLVIIYTSLMSAVFMAAIVYQGLKTPAEELTELKSTESNIFRTIMKSRITKLAAAAVTIIAILVAVSYFGLTVNVAAPAFADMIEEISKAHSVIYKQTIYTEDSSFPATKHMVNEYGVTRSINQYGGVAIYDRKSGKELRLNAKSKNAQILYKVGRDKGKGLINYLDWLSNLHGKSADFISQEEIDGKIANVFVIERDFRATIRTTTVWVDSETDLPVRVEMVDMPDPNKDIIVPKMSLDVRDFGGEADDIRTITIQGDGVQDAKTVVKSDFVWNPNLDESLFSLEPPKDYAVEEIIFDVSDKGENGLIDALAFWTKMSGGLFPSEINDLCDPNKVRPMLIEIFDRDGDPKEEFDQAMKQMHQILKGLWFAQKCKVQGNWCYAGDNVRLGESDKPVCWWKSENSDTFRVIYGDLSLADSNEAPQQGLEE